MQTQSRKRMRARRRACQGPEFEFSATASLIPALLALCSSVGLGQTYSILHSFDGPDGAYPEARLVVLGDTLYGTTCAGGSSNAGTVFQLHTNGSGFSVLHHFTTFADGANPQAGLILAGTTLYGTTCSGGISNSLCVAPSGREGAPCGDGKLDGGGTLFKLNLDGSGYAVLHRFAGPDFSTGQADGLSPQASLWISGAVIYGTTFQGGQALCPGAVFRMNEDGTGFAVLRTGAGPWFPAGGLVASGSTLYGTSCSGGTNPYSGTVFRINDDGTGFNVLKAFGDGSDGAAPYGDLLLDGTWLYGTTSGDGEGHVGHGTVFKANVDGTGYAVLKNFTGLDGSSPRAGLVLAGGVLYGTTRKGGNLDQGTVFKVNTDGSQFAVLKHFSGGTDGGNPFSELVFSEGVLYGTTAAGGASGKGVVFSLSFAPGLVRAPGSQTAEAGSSAMFTAAGNGPPPLTYLWYFEGTNLLVANTNSVLQLTNLQSTQAGAYSVRITNLFGSITSPPAYLSVIPSVPRRVVPGLSLTGQPGYELYLESSTDLAVAESWSTLQNAMLTNSPQWFFDLAAPLPQRSYRAWQAGPTQIGPSLNIYTVPALTLTGTIGSSLRIDYINQFGPVNAWSILDTVTLGNSSQLYFDIAAPGQPPRLYRIVPVR